MLYQTEQDRVKRFVRLSLAVLYHDEMMVGQAVEDGTETVINDAVEAIDQTMIEVRNAFADAKVFEAHRTELLDILLARIIDVASMMAHLNGVDPKGGAMTLREMQITLLRAHKGTPCTCPLCAIQYRDADALMKFCAPTPSEVIDNLLKEI